MKLLGLFLIHCVFTKKTESAKVRHSGRQKFVKPGTGKNKGFREHCVYWYVTQICGKRGVERALAPPEFGVSEKRAEREITIALCQPLQI